MYIFEAHYINMENNEEITREIKFDGDIFLNTEKECYLYAMGIAFEAKEKNEYLSSIEFIAC